MWKEKCEEMDRCLGGTKETQAWKFIRNFRREKKNEGNINLTQNKKWKEYHKWLLIESRLEFLEGLGDVAMSAKIDICKINKEGMKRELKEI